MATPATDYKNRLSLNDTQLDKLSSEMRLPNICFRSLFDDCVLAMQKSQRQILSDTSCIAIWEKTKQVPQKKTKKLLLQIMEEALRTFSATEIAVLTDGKKDSLLYTALRDDLEVALVLVAAALEDKKKSALSDVYAEWYQEIAAAFQYELTFPPLSLPHPSLLAHKKRGKQNPKAVKA